MKSCRACGVEFEGAGTTALVVEMSGAALGGKVCDVCAKRGTLVVPITQEMPEAIERRIRERIVAGYRKRIEHLREELAEREGESPSEANQTRKFRIFMYENAITTLEGALG